MVRRSALGFARDLGAVALTLSVCHASVLSAVPPLQLLRIEAAKFAIQVWASEVAATLDADGAPGGGRAASVRGPSATGRGSGSEPEPAWRSGRRVTWPRPGRRGCRAARATQRAPRRQPHRRPQQLEVRRIPRASPTRDRARRAPGEHFGGCGRRVRERPDRGPLGLAFGAAGQRLQGAGPARAGPGAGRTAGPVIPTPAGRRPLVASRPGRACHCPRRDVGSRATEAGAQRARVAEAVGASECPKGRRRSGGAVAAATRAAAAVQWLPVGWSAPAAAAAGRSGSQAIPAVGRGNKNTWAIRTPDADVYGGKLSLAPGWAKHTTDQLTAQTSLLEERQRAPEGAAKAQSEVAAE